MYKKDMVLCFIDQAGKSNYHLGAAYMIANLRKYGYKADLYVNYHNKGIDTIVDGLLKDNPRAIGFTLYDTNYFLVKDLCNRIKEKSKNVFVFIGGATATFCYEKILRDCPACDGCILFEGEVTSVEILQYLDGKRSKNSILNFVYIDNQGDLVKNAARKVMKDLDEFPSPYLSGIIDPVAYYENHKNSWHRMVQIISSRGCVFSCKYCSNTVLGHNIIRFHSLDRTIEEMKFIKETFEKNKIKARVQFMDDIFTFNKKRTLEFCERVINENVGLEFAIQTRPDCIDEEQIRMLAKAGCVSINFGLENTNPIVLHSMGKCPGIANSEGSCVENAYIEATRNAVCWANKNRMYVAVNMITGWENQSYQSYLQDIQFLEELGADYVNTASLIFYPGTAIYQRAADKVKDKVQYMEKKSGMIFSYVYDYFPELYPFEHSRIVTAKGDSSEYFKVRRKILLQAIMGIRNKNQFDTIVYQNEYPDYEWLKRNVNATSKIAYFNDSDKEAWFFGTYAFGYDYVLYNSAYEYDCQINSKGNVEGPIPENNMVRASIIDLDTTERVEYFFTNLKHESFNNIIEVFSVERSNKLIADYCRWCTIEHRCPARDLSRIVIKKDGIYTCQNGIKICDIGVKINWERVNQDIEKLCTSVEERRGCKNCEVSHICTKCLALGDMTDEEYCRFQREMPRDKNKMIYNLKTLESFAE